MKINLKTVILAGGKGKRLYPYTTNFPKALMPINDKPILEIVICYLKKFGIRNVIISTGHLEELIRAFFGDGKKFGVKIEYSKEETQLGTAGPLSLLKNKLKDTFILMNSDVISDIDLNEFYHFHVMTKSKITIAVSRREAFIDFGVIRVNNKNEFSGWDEKPVLNYNVSTGIYLIEPEILKYVPKNTPLDIPDFIFKLNSKKIKIGCYLHKGYWLDIGRPEDYEKACTDWLGS
jgi:NDP-sugar pyrophosphorylase family protein